MTKKETARERRARKKKQPTRKQLNQEERDRQKYEIDTYVPPPVTEKVNVSLRITKDDYDILHAEYPRGISAPARRLLRRLADTIRKDRGLRPLGPPTEPYRPPKDETAQRYERWLGSGKEPVERRKQGDE